MLNSPLDRLREHMPDNTVCVLLNQADYDAEFKRTCGGKPSASLYVFDKQLNRIAVYAGSKPGIIYILQDGSVVKI